MSIKQMILEAAKKCRSADQDLDLVLKFIQEVSGLDPESGETVDSEESEAQIIQRLYQFDTYLFSSKVLEIIGDELPNVYSATNSNFRKLIKFNELFHDLVSLEDYNSELLKEKAKRTVHSLENAIEKYLGDGVFCEDRIWQIEPPIADRLQKWIRELRSTFHQFELEFWRSVSSGSSTDDFPSLRLLNDTSKAVFETFFYMNDSFSNVTNDRISRVRDAFLTSILIQSRSYQDFLCSFDDLEGYRYEDSSGPVDPRQINAGAFFHFAMKSDISLLFRCLDELSDHRHKAKESWSNYSSNAFGLRDQQIYLYEFQGKKLLSYWGKKFELTGPEYKALKVIQDGISGEDYDKLAAENQVTVARTDPQWFHNIFKLNLKKKLKDQGLSLTQDIVEKSGAWENNDLYLKLNS